MYKTTRQRYTLIIIITRNITKKIGNSNYFNDLYPKMAAIHGCHGDKGERGGLVLLEADRGAVFGALVAGLDELVLAELLDGGEGGVLTGEDEVDGALACDVLDLTT